MAWTRAPLSCRNHGFAKVGGVGSTAQRTGDGRDRREHDLQITGCPAGDQLIANEAAGRALSADPDEFTRLLLLRHTYEDRGPGLLAGPAVPMPVVCTASILFTDIRGFSRLTERFAHDPARLLPLLHAQPQKLVP